MKPFEGHTVLLLMPPVKRARKNSSATDGDPASSQSGEEPKTPPSSSSCSSSLSHLSYEDHVITLNIGGTAVATLASTLLHTPSHFRKWIPNHFEDFSRDDLGRPFIDRDPTTFRHMLNCWRGYGLPEDTDAYPFLVEDAIFYGAEDLMRDLGASPVPWRFSPGPGVSTSGTDFSTAKILGICGADPLDVEQEDHYICFRFEKAEQVEVGVISALHIRQDAMLSEQAQAIGFRNTGELVKKLGEDAEYDDSTMTKADNATIRVRFERCVETSSLVVRGSAIGVPTGASIEENQTAALDPFSFPPETNASPALPILPASGAHLHSVVSASITFESGDRKCVVVWPSPVPPLYFAVSMSGTSSAIITSSSSPLNPW